MAEQNISSTAFDLNDINNFLNTYQFKPHIEERGIVESVGDGIVWIRGLPNAAIDEILTIEDGSKVLVFHLAEAHIGAIVLKQTAELKAGCMVFHSNEDLVVAVGDQLLGRVIDPLGFALDGQAEPQCREHRLMEVLSPAIVTRDFVSQPLYTGNIILDNLIPVGKGQRELIIGDNGLGKSSLALDIVINQKGKEVYCVYVLIAQKRSSIIDTIEILKAHDALAYTVVVVAEATALPGLKYLAPFAGCAIAEYWMYAGKDTLIVYDDLTEHANCYRELSLLLKRPPGREAYPADIFYLHARLLERSTCLSPEWGGGSMTAFPIIETKEGEIASYIPTNLISITDGQIFFDEKLFSAGFLPAIDITRSVSRIGGKAQPPNIKKEASRIKLDYLQFLELEVFTRFVAKLEPTIQKKIDQGKLLREIFKQDRLSVLPIEFQLVWLVAYNDGILDSLKLEEVSGFLKNLESQIKNSSLTLASEREEWQDWLNQVILRKSK